MAHLRTFRIDAQHLRAAARRHRAGQPPAYAAISNGAHTAACLPRQAGGGWLIHTDPQLAQLPRGAA